MPQMPADVLLHTVGLLSAWFHGSKDNEDGLSSTAGTALLQLSMMRRGACREEISPCYRLGGRVSLLLINDDPFCCCQG